MFLWLLLVPSVLLLLALLHMQHAAPMTAVVEIGLLLLVWALVVSAFTEQVVRPLQTLANVIAALREDDYSFRARGGRRDDAMGDLAIEINALAGMLQARRSNALEAMALVDRVVTAMHAPVLAFAPDGQLRLLNAAGERAFGLEAQASLGKRAEMLGLAHVLYAAPDELISIEHAQGSSRWVVQRSEFRLRGIAHTLLVLSDVSAALREEERAAWRRLIRVLGHEIHNSLTPIKSIAGSLRTQSEKRARGDHQDNLAELDLDRGLAVIENRAESLNHFLQAYSELAQLPSPHRRTVALRPLLERVCQLETRMQVQLTPGPAVHMAADPDQLQQALINLVKNAVDASLSRVWPPDQTGQPEALVTWRVTGRDAVITIADTGVGIANASNLFVPFYTTKAGGTGIGLVLAQQIVEGHGGTIRLRNKAEGGCEAEVRLPIAPAE